MIESAENSPATPGAAVWPHATERLDRVLPELQLARSRSQAADYIAAGFVVVDEKPASKPGQKVATGVTVTVVGGDHYVSRAAHKLIAALEEFEVDPQGSLALDLGASTGGFTQVLLERGASRVLAIDVGHGQMVDRLAHDDRVTLVEGCNARDLTAASLQSLTSATALPTLVVADLSFISLTLVLPAIAVTAHEQADLVLLIKPQFEVGRTGIRDGVVTSPTLRADAIRTVLRAAAAYGYGAQQLAVSPLAGGSGNIEYLVHFLREDAPDPTQWEGRISELCDATT